MINRPDAAGLRRLDLNLLPVFAALMRERSVTRAGRALFLSQPATSAALAKLRAVFRDELFVRNGRVLEPTARATALLGELEPFLAAIGRSLAGAVPFAPATDARVFRLACTEDVAIALLPPLLARLRAEAPGCDLVLRAGNYRTIPAMLDSGEVNTAVAYIGDDLPASAKQRVVRRGGFRVLRDAGTPVVDLDGYCARPHALVTPMGDLTGFADVALAKLGRARRVLLGLPDFALLRRALLGTDLLCTVSDFLAEAQVESGGLASDPPPIECPVAVVRMAWRAAADADPAEAWLRGLVVAILGPR